MKKISLIVALTLVLGFAFTGCRQAESNSNTPLIVGPVPNEAALTADYFIVTMANDTAPNNYWTDFIGASFDGSGTVALDTNLDGTYAEEGVDDPATLDYASLTDGTLDLGSKFVGLFNAALTLFTAADASVADDTEVIMAAGFQQGDAMSDASFTGNYGAVSLAFAGRTRMDTFVEEHVLDGAGNGTREITMASNGGVSGPAAYLYDISPNGRLDMGYNDDFDGILSSDGMAFGLSDSFTNILGPRAAINYMGVSIGVKTGTDSSGALLSGEYEVSEFGAQYETTAMAPEARDVAGEYRAWTSYATIVADGSGNITRTIVEDSGGETGSMDATYTVDADGRLTVNAGPTTLNGFVSSDGKTFVLADTDESDEDMVILFGVKREF